MATPAFMFLKNSRRAALLPSHSRWPVIGNDTPLVAAAIDRSVHNQLSIWDAMVIEAALRSEARTLYTEDLPHGQRFGAMTIIDQFLAEPRTP